MGLIKELVLLPVVPLRGTLWVAQQIAEQVEREQYSEGAGIQQLEQIDAERQRGELDEREAAEREEQVLESQLTRPKRSREDGERG